MSAILVPVGLMLVCGIMIDFLLTTISIRRQGPLTRRAITIASTLLDYATLNGAVSRFRGPILLSVLAILWILGLWVGWSLVVLPGRDAFLGPDEVPAGLFDIVGFVGSTLSTMGLGVITPQIPFWHLVAVGISIAGMVVLTLTMSYVFNVTSVATSSRSYTRRLDLLREETEPLEPTEARELLLASLESLLDQGTILIDRRRSFPLAVHYDRDGSDGDVRRAIRDFDFGRLQEVISVADRVQNARLTMLQRILVLVERSAE